MKKVLLITSAILVNQIANSQYLQNFEDIILSPESAWYGQDQVIDGDTIYSDGISTFELNYNASWGSYTGWAVSNMTDNTTPGYGNQFSAITGSGHIGSSQYGVCYVSSFSNNRVFFSGSMQTEIFVTNTTYAYYAMLNGDAFSKPFGADTSASGVPDGTNGEDWFLLTIYGLDSDSLYSGDSINFYLADYRFSDDSLDYIIDEWTALDLSSLGAVSGLDFVLTSSDTSGGWGMNTPAYFAMDNLEGGFAGIEENRINEILVFPNPATSVVNVQTPGSSNIMIYDISGKLLINQMTENNTSLIDISDLDNGVYLISAFFEGKLIQQKFIKN